MIQVQEYAELTTDNSVTTTPNLAVIQQQTFDWLVGLMARDGYGRFVKYRGPNCIQLQSYVGYLQSPHGEAIEILPKTGLGVENPLLARKVLCKMLCSALHVSAKEAHSADLQCMDLPIHEWIFHQFLQTLNDLVARGLCFDYQKVEEESHFIRGQLDIVKQQRQQLSQAHRFHVRHDIYHPDRIENRLIKTALGYVRRLCRVSDNWRLANSLSHIMAPISELSKPLLDYPQWSDTKIMQPYQAIKPWCQLILEQMNPNFQKGVHQGIALLFPMEQLFETHVANYLQQCVKTGLKLSVQSAIQYLVIEKSEPFNEVKRRFNLKPDLLLIDDSGACHVMDTKWKLLDTNRDNKHFNISQSDAYQMFAYGHKYLNGHGDMMLIYPKHAKFAQPLTCFHYNDDLRLWVVPFCIEKDALVEGAWINKFSASFENKAILAVNT